MTRVRIGTRGSALALWQARYVAARLATVDPELSMELVEISSTGDRITDVPLADVEGTGFFTATLERALDAGEVDVAVHSYKDLPVAHTPGLVVAAVPARGPVEDVLCVSPHVTSDDPRRSTLDGLPRGARVGTCSTRRAAQVRRRRPDLDMRPLRGNVPTRVGRITSGELDAIVLARAGLVRLGLQSHITQVLPLDVMLPAPAQGALAVQCRSDDIALTRVLASLDDGATRWAVEAEREVLHALGGGCSVPVGASAEFRNNQVTLTAGVFALDASRVLRVVVSGGDPFEIGQSAARRLRRMGADEILASCAADHGDPGFDAVAAEMAGIAASAVSRTSPKETS